MELRNISYSTLILVVVVLMVWQSVSAQSNNIFYNQTFRLIAPSKDSCYYFVPAYVYSSAGSTVEGSIIVGLGKVDFYILNSVEDQQFLSRKGGCENIKPPLSELMVIGINSSYAVNYLVPDGGYHYFLFLNPYSSDVAVSLVLGWASSTTTSQPITSYYTTTSNSSVASQPSLSQGLNWFTFTNQFAYLAFLMTAGAAVIFMIWKRRRPGQPSLPPDLASKPASVSQTFGENVGEKTQAKRSVFNSFWRWLTTALQKEEPEDETEPKAETAPEAEKSHQETAFCISCGKELPADWEFCRHCGKKQP